MKARDRVGEYVLQEPIGRGGFGEVWKAEHAELPGATVAVKIPTDPDYVRQLRAAGILQHALEHPCIVKTITLNTSHEPPYLVMEYVPGESLRSLLQRERTLPLERGLSIIERVLGALAYSHAHGVVHRDVKPENILMSTDGRILVTDFGLGVVTEKLGRELALSGSLRTQTGNSIEGTLAYMAPEQRRGEDPDGRSDLYAVGLVLHEMITGDTGPLRFPIKNVPAHVSRAVERATERNPGERPGTAEELISLLHEGIRHPVAERPAPAGGTQGRGGLARAILFIAFTAFAVSLAFNAYLRLSHHRMSRMFEEAQAHVERGEYQDALSGIAAGLREKAQADARDLTASIARLEAEIQNLKAEGERLALQKSEAERDNAAIQDRREELRAEIQEKNDAETRLQQTRQKLEDLSRQVAELKIDVSASEAKKKDLEDRKRAMESEVGQVKAMVKEIEEKWAEAWRREYTEVEIPAREAIVVSGSNLGFRERHEIYLDGKKVAERTAQHTSGASVTRYTVSLSGLSPGAHLLEIRYVRPGGSSDSTSTGLTVAAGSSNIIDRKVDPNSNVMIKLLVR
jgi:serine/threonine protein kinase